MFRIAILGLGIVATLTTSRGALAETDVIDKVTSYVEVYNDLMVFIVQGPPTDDDIRIELDRDEIKLWLNGVRTDTDVPNNVSEVRIIVYAGDGNDDVLIEDDLDNDVDVSIQIFGEAGNDIISNDTEYASSLWGGYGRDVLFGGSGSDVLCGDGYEPFFVPSQDVLFGGDGPDLIATHRRYMDILTGRMSLDVDVVLDASNADTFAYQELMGMNFKILDGHWVY